MSIDVETEGPAAPPRRNGELTFDAPWQARAFGMCLALLERESLEWTDFRPHLVAAIAADDERDRHDYYDSFAVALEDFVNERAKHRLSS